jgi:hypothetical protein
MLLFVLQNYVIYNYPGDMQFFVIREWGILYNFGAGFGLQAAGCRLQAAGYRLQATGYRLQASGFRLQATGYRLQA